MFIRVNVTPQMLRHLRSLLKSGLFGSNIEETAERILCSALIQLKSEKGILPARGKRKGPFSEGL